MRYLKNVLLILILTGFNKTSAQTMSRMDSFDLISRIIPIYFLDQIYHGNMYNLQENSKHDKTVLFNFVESNFQNIYELYLKSIDWQIYANVANYLYSDEEYTAYKIRIDFTNPGDAQTFLNYWPGLLKFNGSNGQYFKGIQTIKKISSTEIEIWRDYPRLQIKNRK